MSYNPKGDADKFMRRVGTKYPWLHPEYDPDNQLWQMRAVKAREKQRAALNTPSQEGEKR